MPNVYDDLERKIIEIDTIPFPYMVGGEGPPLLFLHLPVNPMHVYRQNMPELARQHRIYNVDIRPALAFWYYEGYGSLLTYLSDYVIKFMNVLQLRRVDVVASFMGGGVAMHLAIVHPHRVRRLVLISSLGLIPRPQNWMFALIFFLLNLPGMRLLSNVRWIQKVSLAFDRKILGPQRVREFFYDEPKEGVEWHLEQIYEGLADPPNPFAFDTFLNVIQYLRYREIQHLIPTIEQDVLLLFGREDVLIPPRVAYRYEAALPHATLHIIPKARVFLHWEAAPLVNELIANFLREPDGDATPPRTFVEVHHRRVPYRVMGEGFPLVCSELPLNPYAFFAPLQHQLARHYRVFLPDLRPVVGHSSKAPPAEDLLPYLAAFSLDLLDRLKVRECYLIGSFMYGAVAMEMARLAPERIRKLILINAVGIQPFPITPLMQVITSFYRLPALPLLYRLPLFRALVEWSDYYVLGPKRMQEIFYDPESLGVTLEELYEHYKDPPNHSAAWTLMWAIRHMHYATLVEQLEAVTSPTLIIHGEEDRWIPPHYAQQLNERLPNSRLIEVPQTCHSPELEKVTLTYHHIVTFLQEEST